LHDQDHVLWIKKLYDEIEDASFRKKKDKVCFVAPWRLLWLRCVVLCSAVL
jgi:hypothetical protein